MNKALEPAGGMYGPALARAHAERYNHLFRDAFPWLIDRIKGANAGPRLFDLGCGDGQWLAVAAEAGLAGEGIDVSAAMVARARTRGVTASQNSAARAALPQGTSAVTALGEVLAYEPASLSPALLAATRALPKGGLVIFDLPGPGIPATAGTVRGTGWELSSRALISGNRLTREIRVKSDGETVTETHVLRLFDPEEAQGIATGFGFKTEILQSYGPCPLLPGRFAIAAVKP
jgi:SAM-dependent methyltransferase